MTTIGSSLGIIANTNLAADPKKPEKKTEKQREEMSALRHTQKKDPLDVFSSRFNNILDEGYSEENVPATVPKFSRISAKDFGKDPGVIDNLKNGTAQHVRITNEDGTKNSRTIFKTDAQDSFSFEGKGWKKTENVTDLESWKKDPKHPNTGTLYEDNNGNKVLIVGDGDDDTVTINGKMDLRPPKP